MSSGQPCMASEMALALDAGQILESLSTNRSFARVDDAGVVGDHFTFNPCFLKGVKPSCSIEWVTSAPPSGLAPVFC